MTEPKTGYDVPRFGIKSQAAGKAATHKTSIRRLSGELNFRQDIRRLPFVDTFHIDNHTGPRTQRGASNLRWRSVLRSPPPKVFTPHSHSVGRLGFLTRARSILPSDDMILSIDEDTLSPTVATEYLLATEVDDLSDDHCP